MKKVGLKYRKIAHIPAKANPERQAEWLQSKLEPCIAQAQPGKCHLFFMDAVHFVLGAFLCSLWNFTRLFSKFPSGRQRLNVLGAVNVITKQVEFLTNTTYINAEVIADFFHQLAAKYNNLPIVLVLDNARYQHCQKIEALTLNCFFCRPIPRISILLNGFGNFSKKKTLYGKYYDIFPRFKEAVVNTLQKVNEDLEYRNELPTLLTLKFQTFKDSQIYQA